MAQWVILILSSLPHWKGFGAHFTCLETTGFGHSALKDTWAMGSSAIP